MYTDVDTTNFFTDNYVIIILIAVIVLMTIIGYIADKKDFGKKDKDIVKKDKNKKDKKKKGKEDDKPVDIGQEILAENNEEFSDTVQPDVVPGDTNIIDSFEMPTDLDSVVDQAVTPVEPLDDSSISTDTLEGVTPVELPIDESNVEMVEEPTIDSVSLENSSNETQDENQYDNSTNIEEASDNSWNTSDVTDEMAASPADMELDTNASSEDFKLPNIENIDDQLIENSDDEDVWKF